MWIVAACPLFPANACGARSGLDGTSLPLDAGTTMTRGGNDCGLACPQSVVLFGGMDIATSTFLGDTWEWDGRGWTQRASSGPSARSEHAMATLGDKVVLFGGGEESIAGATVRIVGSPLGDTWAWDGAAWTQRSTTGPSARSGHAMATLAGKVVLFGGAEVCPLCGCEGLVSRIEVDGFLSLLLIVPQIGADAIEISA